MTLAKHYSKAEAHAGPQFRPNGHALNSPSRAARPDRALDGAASDDARESPNAAAVSSTAAGTKRDACAEVAPSAEGETQKPLGKKGKRGNTGTGQKRGANEDSPDVDIPPGTRPLPPDGAGFVDAMHEHVDLYLACARMVKSGDEKIAQRMVERLLEMKFGKPPSAVTEENEPVVIDIDSAVARRAAQGAKA